MGKFDLTIVQIDKDLAGVMDTEPYPDEEALMASFRDYKTHYQDFKATDLADKFITTMANTGLHLYSPQMPRAARRIRLVLHRTLDFLMAARRQVLRSKNPRWSKWQLWKVKCPGKWLWILADICASLLHPDAYY